MQADGKIVLGGGADWPDNSRFALLRYKPNGKLDPTFGGDGIVITNVARQGHDHVAGVEIQPDEKIVAAGGAGGSGGRFALVRYLGT